MYKRKTINYRLHGQIDLNERLAIETGLCCGESFKRIAKTIAVRVVKIRFNVPMQKVFLITLMNVASENRNLNFVRPTHGEWKRPVLFL